MAGLKLSISRERLFVALGKITGVVSSYETMPVLKTYHLQALGKQLRIAATDMELGVTVVADIDKTGSDGDIAVPAKKVDEIVRSVPPKSVIDLEVKEGVVTIRSGKAIWKLRGISGNEFPQMPSFEDSTQVWALQREELLVILERLSPFVAQEGDIRVALKAISVRDKVIMATDGDSLAVQSHAFSCGSVSQIPGGCAKDLSAVLRLSGVKEVIVSQGQEYVFFDVGGDTFFTRLLDSWEFPDVIPVLQEFKSAPPLGFVNRVNFRNAIQRVKVVASDERQVVEIVFSFTNIVVKASVREGDSAEESISFVGQSTGRCSVNWQKLVAALDRLHGEKIELRLGVTCLGLKDESIHLCYLLMAWDD